MAQHQRGLKIRLQSSFVIDSSRTNKTVSGLKNVCYILRFIAIKSRSRKIRASSRKSLRYSKHKLDSFVSVIKRESLPLSCVSAMWLFYACNLIAWESINKRLLAFDEVNHYFNSIAISYGLSHPWVFLNLSMFAQQFAAAHPPIYFTLQLYPPFPYFITSLLYFVRSPSLPVAATTNAAFMIILLFSTYYLSLEFVRSRICGIVAAFLVGGYPFLTGLSRHYLTDYALTALVSLAILLLVRSRSFQKRGTTIALSTVLIAGMLTRITFPLYVAGPLACVAIRGLRSRKSAYNIFLAVALASISGIWYIEGGLRTTTQYYLGGPGPFHYSLGSISTTISSSWNYIHNFFGIAIGVALIPLFILGFLCFLRSANYRLLLIVGIILPIALLGAIDHYYFDPRFVAPLLSLAAIASSSILSLRRAQFIAALAIVLLVGVQFAAITYAPATTWAQSHDNLDVVPLLTGMTPPSDEDWKIPQMISAVVNDSKANHISNPKLQILVIEAFIDQTLFDYYAYQMGGSLYTVNIASGPAGVCESNYVIMRTMGESFVASPMTSAGIQAVRFVRSNLVHFTLVGTYPLPDNSTVGIYRNDGGLPCQY